MLTCSENETTAKTNGFETLPSCHAALNLVQGFHCHPVEIPR